MKISTRYFPFAPGIGWKIKNGKYIIPEVNLDVWNKITANKNIVVVAYGGLIESYISLCYLEMLNYIVPENAIYWCGKSKFESLVYLNGIAKLSHSFSKEFLVRYPTPIFMDVDQNVYFNCFNNVLIVKPYYGGVGYKDKSPLIKQLLRNSALPWNKQYVPQFRRLSFPTKDFLQWSRLTKFDLNQPYICLFQNLEWSEHKKSALKWNEIQIKSLSAMLRQRGISTVVFTNAPGKFYGSSVYCVPLVMDTILHLIRNAKAVLSEEIDFLLLALMSSSAKIIMNPVDKHLLPIQNEKFLKLEKNNVFLAKKWNPVEVFNIINRHGTF